jgi:hypothetical protein
VVSSECEHETHYVMFDRNIMFRRLLNKIYEQVTQPHLSFSEDVHLLTGSLKGEDAGMLVYHNRI